jgi:predicted TPR repeat methyltransferase
MPDKDYLSRVFELEGTDATRAYYDRWSGSYEAEIARAGYATPERAAAALARFATDRTAPTLDFGCGTGLAGAALRAAGFVTLDGTDLSPEMLALAAQKAIYRNLWLSDAKPDLPRGTWAHIAAVGVIGPGAAPPEALDRLAAALAPGGLLVLSFNDRAASDARYAGRLAEYVDTGALEVLLSEHGPHLPGIRLGAIIYVLRKR